LKSAHGVIIRALLSPTLFRHLIIGVNSRCLHLAVYRRFEVALHLSGTRVDRALTASLRTYVY
jgi:hypothetical protein